MPNFQITDLPDAIIPLDDANTFFEVQTIEGGIPVSRRTSADNLTFTTDGLSFAGIHDASSGDPAIPASGNTLYRISVAGSITGAGSVEAGDDIYYNNTDWNRINNQPGSFVRGTSVDDPTAPGTFDSNFQWQQAAGLLLARAGFNTDIDFAIRNVVHGGTISLEAEDTAGVLRTLFAGDPDGSSELYEVGTLVLTSTSLGVDVQATSGANNPATGGSQNQVVGFNNTTPARTMEFGFTTLSTDLRIDNHVHGGPITLSGQDVAGGATRDLFKADPDGAAQMFQQGTATLRTTTAGAGGAQANNTLTGAGFERVLTTGDAFGGALNDLSDVTLTTPATGAVLYKSAGDWIDTPGILIDPAADVKLHQATVEVFRTLTAAAGGAEANNTLTGAGFERVLTASDAFLGIITGSSINPPTTPGGTFDGNLRFENANNLETGRVGFNPTGDTFYMSNTVWGGRSIISGISTGGTTRDVYEIDYSSAVGAHIFREPNGTQELMRLDTGVNAVTQKANVLNQPSAGGGQVGGFRVQNRAGSPEISMFVGFNETILQTELQLYSLVHAGTISIYGEQTGGGKVRVFFGDPDGVSSLQHNGTTMFRTKTAATGGAEANNTQTGGGLERVLTTSDLAGATGGASVFDVVSAAAVDVALTLTENVTLSTTLQHTVATDITLLRNEVDSGHLQLRGRSSTSVDAVLATFDPDGPAELYHDESLRFLTSALGVEVRGSAANAVTLIMEDSAGTDMLTVTGTSTLVTFVSEIDGSTVRFRGSDLGASIRTLWDADPDGDFSAYRIGALRAGTRFDGWRILGLLSNVPSAGGTQDVSLEFQNLVGTIAGALRYTTSIDMRLENFVHGGSIQLYAEDTGGTLRTLILADPDADVKLHQVGVEVARTNTVALGGFEIDNQLTGGGFERALTQSDIISDVNAADDVMATATLATVLTASGLAALTTYSIECYLVFSTPVADSFQYRITTGADTHTGEGQWDSSTTTEGGVWTVDVAEVVVSTAAEQTVHIVGRILTDATGGSITVDVAKNADAAGDGTFQLGSWIRMIPLI